MPSPGFVYTVLSPAVFPILDRKTVVEGAEHLPTEGGYILAPNHVDWLDGFYLSAALKKHRQLPINFLAKTNNYWWTGIAIQIPTDRSQVVSSMAEELRRGKVICNFPEGRRNTGTQLLPGKTGTVRMAAEAQVPVIPMGMVCEPGQTMGQSFHHLFSSKYPMTLHFGQPLRFHIPPRGISAEWLSFETERLMKAIASLANKTI